MSPNLQEYLSTLEESGELLRVRRQVTKGPEILSVVKALEPYGAPAVLFESVADSPWPVVMGTFGTRARLARSLGIDKGELVERAIQLPFEQLPEPITVSNAASQEMVLQEAEIDLKAMPFAQHSKSDAGEYITAGVVLARDPRTGKLNTGMYRMMVTSSHTITVNAAPDHDLGRIFAAARERQEKVPIAVIIGHHPAYLVGSQVKNTVAVDSHEIVGGLLNEALRVTPAVSVDLPVPADAEMILEGVVDPRDMLSEGPFGEFSYHYGEAKAPVCTITAVTHRRNPIFLDLHPTHAEHLCLWLYPGREARLLEGVRRSVPGAVVARIPFHGGSFSAYISVKKRKEGDGKQAILAAFATDHFLKNVIVVDADIDVLDTGRVLWAADVRVQADVDTLRLESMKGIRMDPSAKQFFTPIGSDTLTAKVGVDATRPLTGFPEQADLPHPGFENLQFEAYLSPEDTAKIIERKGFREDFME